MAQRGPIQDEDLIARIIVTSMLRGDEEASLCHSVSPRTIQRYRALMRADDGLAKLVAQKKAAVESSWQGDLRDAIQAGIKFLKRSAEEADATDPDAIHAIAGAIKVMSETDMTSKVIDARLAAQDRSSREEYGEVAPALTEETTQVTH